MTLEKCANGDGNPVCPPSKVICRACIDRITANLQAMADRMAQPTPAEVRHD